MKLIVYFFTCSKKYEYIFISLLILLTLNIICQFIFYNWVIAILHFICSFLIIIIINSVEKYIVEKWRPKQIPTDVIIRNLNINYLNSDIKLDTYHKYMIKHLEKLFKNVNVKREIEDDKITIIFKKDDSRIEIVNDEPTIHFNYISEYTRTEWYLFMYIYNINDNYGTYGVGYIAKWYINKYLI